MEQKKDSEAVPHEVGWSSEAVNPASAESSGTGSPSPEVEGSPPSKDTEKRQSLPNGEGSPASADLSGPGTASQPSPKAEGTAPQPEKPQTAEEKAAEYYNQLVRLKAEFENYRKRVEREKPELVKWGKAGILLKLIPLYDVLLNAHAHVNKAIGQNKSSGEQPSSGQHKAETEELFKGLEIIFKEFSKVFESEGIQVMETVGKPCDPMAHEVMGTVEGNSSNDGAVVEELQRGFTVEGRVLRPARVRIAKKKEK